MQADQTATERPSWLSDLNFLWIEVTHKCNLQCVHCYADSKPTLPLAGMMSYEDWQKILREGFEMGCRAVQFIGGEPTLCPSLPRLVADARSVGYDFVEVYTNGTKINSAMLDSFSESRVALAFSVYAHCAEIHDGITGQKGSFEKTIENIKLAVQRGFSIRVGVIVMASTEGIDVEKAKELLRGIGATDINVDRVRGIGRGLRQKPNGDPYQELCGSCWKGKLCIDPDGNAYPCVFSSFCRLGNAKNGLRHILESANLHAFRDKLRNQEMLAGCPPSLCHPDVCPPANRPCSPDCAPSCDPCVPDIRRRA